MTQSLISYWSVLSNIIGLPRNAHYCLPDDRYNVACQPFLFASLSLRAMFVCSKKDINSKNKVFVTHALFPCHRFLWGKCKDLQRKGRISQVFCLGPVVTIRVTENSPAIKILHDGIPGMPHRFWVKVYLAFFSFVNSYY